MSEKYVQTKKGQNNEENIQKKHSSSEKSNKSIVKDARELQAASGAGAQGMTELEEGTRLALDGKDFVNEAQEPWNRRGTGSR